MLKWILALFPALAGAQTGIKHLDAAAFGQALAQNPQAVVLDVRSPSEYAGGHIPKARNLDVNASSFASQVASLPRNAPCYVYCLGGVRSVRAAQQMVKMGFTQVYNLSGGISSWRGAVVK